MFLAQTLHESGKLLKIHKKIAQIKSLNPQPVSQRSENGDVPVRTDAWTGTRPGANGFQNAKGITDHQELVIMVAVTSS